MMRSLFSGVSGLKSHQTRMDVIGNNIANVNTTGFKSSRVTFADTLSQTLSGASAPQGTLGGTNPKQIGFGTGVASIDMLFTDGSVQSTGKNTDLCLSGNGLFVVKQGGQTYYTRNGAFAFDAEGNYVLPGSGLYVQGWTAENGVLPATENEGNMKNITIPSAKGMASKATKTATYENNLKADTAGYEISSITVNYADGTSKTGLSNFEATPSAKGSITLHTNTGKAIPLDETAAYPFTTGDPLAGKTLWTSKIDSVKADGGGATLTLGTGDAVFSINGTTTLTCTAPLKDGNTYSIGGTYTITGTIDTSGVTTNSPATGQTTLKVTLNDAANNSTKVTITVPQPENFNYKDGDPVSFSLPITSIKAANGAKLNTANGQQVSLDNGPLDITSADQTYEYKGTAADGNVASIERVGPGAMYNGKEVSSVSIVTTDGKILDGLAGAKYQKGSMFYPSLTTSLSIYDTEGKSYSVPVLLTKTNANTWAASLANGTNSTTITESNGDVVTVSLDSSELKFDNSGKYVSGNGTLKLKYADHDGNPTAADQSVTLNFAALTQYSGFSTVKGDTDGNAAGMLSSISIDSSGIIMGTYTNGVKQTEAQVAVAQFNNAAGLTKTGSSLYQESNNSGEANVKTAADLGVTITPSALEMSNVDIANEFSDMIITQRGFQSNSKIITVGDEMLETLINMKR